MSFGGIVEVGPYFEHSACNSCQVVSLFGANSDVAKNSHTHMSLQIEWYEGTLPNAINKNKDGSHLALGALL